MFNYLWEIINLFDRYQKRNTLNLSNHDMYVHPSQGIKEIEGEYMTLQLRLITDLFPGFATRLLTT